MLALLLVAVAATYEAHQSLPTADAHAALPDPSDSMFHSGVLHSPFLSQLSAISPLPLPFLDRLDPLLSGAFPLSNFLSPHWWYEQLASTWAQDPGHLLLELLCLCVIGYLYLRKPYDPRDQERLSPQEEEELLRTWRPEPLHSSPHPNTALRTTPIVTAYSHQHLTIAGRSYLSFASSNFLGIAGLPSIRAACRATIEKYGVGSCGPRGFYGSFDIHLEVEARLADFFHGQACILYSDGIATLASVIPAFSKRGDLIVCDDAVHFGIQQGIRLSRSNVLYYKHNDMEDLERILRQVQEKELRQPQGKLNRRFIITEGISEHCGDVAPLPHIIRLKQRYRYRLILDDSFAIGVLGNTGRGSLEHWSVDSEQCDLYCASLDHSTATVGGFCIGSNQVVDHQRLSGAGYCFSASSPPYTATAAILALEHIQQHPELCKAVRDRAGSTRKLLSTLPLLQVTGKPERDGVSPVIPPHPAREPRQPRGGRGAPPPLGQQAVHRRLHRAQRARVHPGGEGLATHQHAGGGHRGARGRGHRPTRQSTRESHPRHRRQAR